MNGFRWQHWKGLGANNNLFKRYTLNMNQFFSRKVGLNVVIESEQDLIQTWQQRNRDKRQKAKELKSQR